MGTLKYLIDKYVKENSINSTRIYIVLCSWKIIWLWTCRSIYITYNQIKEIKNIICLFMKFKEINILFKYIYITYIFKYFFIFKKITKNIIH